jgi:hypothetical protein
MTVKQDVLNTFKGYALTADEAARELGFHVLSVRPRVTELLNEGWLYRTGFERPTELGAPQAVLTAFRRRWSYAARYQRLTFTQGAH